MMNRTVVAIAAAAACAVAQAQLQVSPPPVTTETPASPAAAPVVSVPVVEEVLVSAPAALPPAQPTRQAPEVSVPPLQPRVPAQKAAQSPRDKALADAVRRWEQTGQADALVGQGGDVRVPYGYSRPVIPCAPLQVCAIRLIPGESITALAIGDTVRWMAQQTTAGDTPVVLIKPTQGGIQTNIVITTDAGRVYYMHAIGKKDEYQPMTSFYDPDDMLRTQTAEAREIERLKKRIEQAEADARRAREEAASRAAQKRDEAIVAEAPGATLDPTKLNFNWRCEANSRSARDFVPQQVFSSATHTFIKLKPDAAEFPGVFAKDGAGYALLNFRRKGEYVVVDGAQKHIVLAASVGDNAKLVDCVRRDAE
jgi:type IV secretion system protein VirB9